MKYTANQKRLIKASLLADIRPWSGTLYHGSPLAGIACILENGFIPDSSQQSMGGHLFSTSNNPRALEYFGRDEYGGQNGFRFKVDFKRVLVLSDFWYAIFMNTGATSDFIEDMIEVDPNVELEMKKMGLGRDGDFETSYFMDEFIPREIESLIIPGFFSKNDREEREMAITITGAKKLKKFTDAVIIDYSENSWTYAKQVIKELGVEPEDCQ